MFSLVVRLVVEEPLVFVEQRGDAALVGFQRDGPAVHERGVRALRAGAFGAALLDGRVPQEVGQVTLVGVGGDALDDPYGVEVRVLGDVAGGAFACVPTVRTDWQATGLFQAGPE